MQIINDTLLSSFYRWPRNIQNGKDRNDWMGPPSTGGGNTKDVQCFREWACEHRWRQITNMVCTSKLKPYVPL